MAKRNPSYDFKWCPGCGDFGVKRAIEMALTARASEKQERIENSVIVAGIGCSGNLVHLQEDLYIGLLFLRPRPTASSAPQIDPCNLVLELVPFL